LCDFAIVAEDAELGFVQERIGNLGAGEPFTLSLMLTVGLKRTRDLLLTGRRFSGKEAEQMQLVTKAVPAAKLEEEVKALAADIKLMPRDGIAIGKANLELLMNIMGMHTASVSAAHIMHTLFTNLRWEPDEYNFFKERRDKGLSASLHGMHDRFKKYPPKYLAKREP